MSTRDILSLANYVWKNYPLIRGKIEFWHLLSLLDRNQEKIIFIKHKEEYVGAAFYLRLSEDNLLKVIMGEWDLTNSKHLAHLLKDNGDNIHFVYCVAGSVRTILKGLKKMIKHERPNSISWFKPEMDRIHMVQFKKESEICLQPS